MLSIIIPTLNEEAHLADTVAFVQKNAVTDLEKEILVVDSGSTDKTLFIAESLDVSILALSDAPFGKFYPLNEGAKKTTGDILLFLDADTILPVGYDEEIKNALYKEAVVGGAFEFCLDGKGWKLRLVEWINRLRYRVRHRFYGDQGIFVRKDAFAKVGGYPEMPIMEAAHFCKELRKLGKLCLIAKPAISSSRRFLKGGTLRVLLSDIKIWWFDLWGISTERLAKPYWQKNANKSFSS